MTSFFFKYASCETRLMSVYMYSILHKKVFRKIRQYSFETCSVYSVWESVYPPSIARDCRSFFFTVSHLDNAQ